MSMYKDIMHDDITDEERKFWDTHDTSEMNLTPVDVVFVRRSPMKSVSLRLPESDLERIKRLAQKYGIPYTNLIRNMIKRELQILEKTETK